MLFRSSVERPAPRDDIDQLEVGEGEQHRERHHHRDDRRQQWQRAISGGALGEGAAISIAMVPFLLSAILFSYFGLQRRAWQQGGSDK